MIEPKSVEALDLFRNATRVGQLRRTAKGCLFEFDAAYFADPNRVALATQLPATQRVIETHGINLPTYFAGLIPEGLRFDALVARTKTSEDDLFTLLVASGSDCVGELFPMLPGQTPHTEVVDQKPLDETDFAELLEQSLGSAIEPAVAGVQEKISAAMISFPFPTRGKRFILKLNPPKYPRLLENEHFFMTMAGRCGLRVAKTELVTDRTGATGLLVERFDRQVKGSQWRGFHQEDLCQVLDRYPADKYRVPTSALFDALDETRCPAPIAERMRLMQLVAFSYVIGNGDLHAKNVSVQGRVGEMQLSPGYDLLSTRPYGDPKLALKLEGRDDNVKRRNLLALGERAGLRARAITTMLDRLITNARPFIARIAEIGFDTRRTKLVQSLMTKRLADLSS